MARHRELTVEAPAQDSFLDVLANLVGCLIILVTAVGAVTRDKYLEASRAELASQVKTVATEKSPEELRGAAQLELAQRDVVSLRREVEHLAGAAKNVGDEMTQRFQQRGQLQQVALAAQQLIDDEKKKLDANAQQDFELRQKLNSARKELEDLDSTRIAVENSAAPVAVLKHLPTPMAKTVFGQEEHFRLTHGRLVRVPMTELVNEMKQQAELKVYKLKEAPQITEIIGPVDGFTMKYTLHRTKVAINTNQGTAVREVADLAGFVLTPSLGDDQLGEPLDIALGEGSIFRQRLSRLDPNRTTITVWTYPDSFADFRKLKDELYELGYLTAGRPMPAGHPIGGSPRGTRSSVQ